jgi:hypothetical protein
MGDQLKPGDRVRVTDRNGVQGYEAGDKGMVRAVASIPAIGDQLHYQVAMDKDGGVTRSVFTAEEIELDVGPTRTAAREDRPMSASEEYILGTQAGSGTMFISGENPHCCGYVGAPADAKRFSSPEQALAYRAEMPWSRGGGPEQYHVLAITPGGIRPVVGDSPSVIGSHERPPDEP